MCPSSAEILLRNIDQKWIKNITKNKEYYNIRNIYKEYCKKTAPYKILRVTAVMTARDDGTQPLAKIENGEVIPIEPYLRNPDKHKKPDENYIRDWIELANLQLLYSGADFGLDVKNIQYVLEPSTLLHERECGDKKHEDTLQYIEKKRVESTDSPYRDSVIIIFRWGKNPAKPTGQGCSDVTSPYILMPGNYRDEPLYMDGQLVFGNNHLTHELGHFMGLVHPFPWLADKITELASIGNPKNLPLTTSNLSEMQGVTETDIQQRKQQAIDWISTWIYSLEQDTGGYPDAGIPDEYGITDTPIDLGPGLPLLHGQLSCQGTYDYTFNRFNHTDLQEVKDENGNVIWWKPKPGAVPSIEDHVTLNDIVRRNVMNYWNCNPERKVFSNDQVRRMHYVLENIHNKLVNRVIERKICRWFPPILIDIYLLPWFPIVIPRYQEWDLEKLKNHIGYLERSNQLEEIKSALSEHDEEMILK